MKVRLATVARVSPSSSYRIYTEKIQHALSTVPSASPEVLEIPMGGEGRWGGVLRPTYHHLIGRFAPDGSIYHATEPNTALRGVDVVTLHDLFPFAVPGVMFRVFRWVIRSAARRARRIVTLTGVIREDVERWLGPEALAKTVVVPPPFVRPPPGRSDRKYDLLWVGSRDPRKRPDRFLHGLASAPEPRLRVAFLCHPGGTEADGAFRAGVAEAGRIHEVDWIPGNVPEAELDRLYRSSGALVSTSTVEGYHYPVMEAWSRGTPVILPTTPLYRGIYGDRPGVHYYRPEAGFARAVSEALGAPSFDPDPALLTEVSPEHVGRRLTELYEELR